MSIITIKKAKRPGFHLCTPIGSIMAVLAPEVYKGYFHAPLLYMAVGKNALLLTVFPISVTIRWRNDEEVITE